MDWRTQAYGFWHFTPSIRKNSNIIARDQHKSIPIKNTLNDRISFYLTYVRPQLQKRNRNGNTTNHFWIQSNGKPLNDDNNLVIMRNIVEKSIGRKFTIRELRRNLNATFYSSNSYRNDADKKLVQFFDGSY